MCCDASRRSPTLNAKVFVIKAKVTAVCSRGSEDEDENEVKFPKTHATK